MSVPFDDEGAIAALWNALAPAIQPRHPVSGVAFDPPASLVEQAGLLNAYLYDPEVVLVWSKTMTYAHLAVWRDYINASRRRFAIVCPSDKGNRRETDRVPSTPFWPADTGFDPLRFLPAAPSLQVLLYSTNDRKNYPFLVYLPTYMHVNIGHGDSDKLSSANRFVTAYDALIVADRHAIDRFIAADVPIPLDRFLPIGASVVDGAAFRPDPKPLRNVLYAPTFEGWTEEANFCSVDRIAGRLREFLAAANDRLIVRGHHAIGNRLPAYKETLKEIAEDAYSVGKDKAAQFNWSDVMICDVSGVLSEYLFTGRPIVIPAAAGDLLVLNQARAAGLDRYCYLWPHDEIGLDDFLISIAHDPKRAERLTRRDALYQGVTSFAEASALFDRAITFLMETHHFRRARSTLDRVVQAAAPVLPPELEVLAERVRSGEIVLRLPGAMAPDQD